MKRTRTKAPPEVIVNVTLLIPLLLSRIEGFSLGILAAFLRGSATPVNPDLPKKGVLVSFNLSEEPGVRWAGETPIALNVFVFFREDAVTYTAGEIQESIRKGLEAQNLYVTKGLSVAVKFLKHEHVGYEKGQVVSEKQLPGTDLHLSRFELVMQRDETKESAEGTEAKEA